MKHIPDILLLGLFLFLLSTAGRENPRQEFPVYPGQRWDATEADTIIYSGDSLLTKKAWIIFRLK